MTTIEELLHTIEELISLVNEGLDHAVGRHGESDLTEKMRERLEQIIDEHRKND